MKKELLLLCAVKIIFLWRGGDDEEGKDEENGNALLKYKRGSLGSCVSRKPSPSSIK